MSKCSNCLFKSNYIDMGWSADVCTRGNYRIDEAIEAVKNPEACQWHITREQLQKYQESMQAPSADVAPKSEVDALEKEIERLKKTLNNYALQYGTVMSQQKVIDKAKSEVAREIFEEIEDLLHKHFFEWDFCYFDEDLGEDFDELKKKYTEVEG